MIVKLALLLLLWWAFFSDPIDVRIGDSDVARMMFSPQPPPPARNGPVHD